jgi:hypothetical protein
MRPLNTDFDYTENFSCEYIGQSDNRIQCPESMNCCGVAQKGDEGKLELCAKSNQSKMESAGSNDPNNWEGWTFKCIEGANKAFSIVAALVIEGSLVAYYL